jgi:hypothetical protein
VTVTRAGRLVLFVLAAASPGWIAATEEPQSPGVESAEEILRAPPSESSYGETRRCLRSNRIDRTRVLSNQHIVFETSRTERWLVQMPIPCPGLRAGSALAFERKGPDVCAMDIVRVIVNTGMGAGQRGAACQLAPFERVSQDQVDALRQAIAAERRGKPAAGG